MRERLTSTKIIPWMFLVILAAFAHLPTARASQTLDVWWAGYWPPNTAEFQRPSVLFVHTDYTPEGTDRYRFYDPPNDIEAIRSFVDANCPYPADIVLEATHDGTGRSGNVILQVLCFDPSGRRLIWEPPNFDPDYPTVRFPLGSSTPGPPSIIFPPQSTTTTIVGYVQCAQAGVQVYNKQGVQAFNEPFNPLFTKLHDLCHEVRERPPVVLVRYTVEAGKAVLKEVRVYAPLPK